MDVTSRGEAARHVGAVVVAAVLVVTAAAGGTVSVGAAIAVAAVAAVVGMPHGALDIVVGPRHLGFVSFFAIYGVAMTATLAAWLLAPLVALSAFLAMSWFHFATGDAEHHTRLGTDRFAVGIAGSGLILGSPLVLHTARVTDAASDLVGAAAAPSAATVQTVGVVMVAVAVAAALRGVAGAWRARAVSPIVELMTLATLCVAVDPLVAFAAYFVCWHTVRHHLVRDVDRRSLVPALALSVLTIAAGAGAWLLVSPTLSGAQQIVFIGLSMLTTPHLIVTELVRRQLAPAADTRPTLPTPASSAPLAPALASTSFVPSVRRPVAAITKALP